MVDTYRSNRLSREEKIEAQRQEDEDIQLEEERELEEEEAYQRELEENQEILIARRQQERQIQEESARKKIEEIHRGKPTLFRYSPAIIVATLKDLLDLVGFSLPVLSFVIAAIFGFLIFVLLLLAKTNSSLVEMRFVIRRAVIFICGFIIEAFLFGINFLPVEVLTVLLIYWVDKHFTGEQIEKATAFYNALKMRKN
ncbi:MAG: hypothetical protein KIH67_002935 [Candidatus Moranbacteria bacterium]|nr:hypothetical protein [Candidatus Moranbacteria bacterium]